MFVPVVFNSFTTFLLYNLALNFQRGKEHESVHGAIDTLIKFLFLKSRKFLFIIFLVFFFITHRKYKFLKVELFARASIKLNIKLT